MKKFIESLIEKLENLPEGRRYLLGIVGCPAAGKTTLAHAVVESVNRAFTGQPAIVVPMDGFHLDNEELEQRGILQLKGIPESFDAEGFRELITELARQPAGRVNCPAFDRSIESTVKDAITVKQSHRLAVIEGNYLLYEEAPWHALRRFFDETWYIDSTDDIILPRLRQRHASGGKSEADIRRKIESTDLPNARLIEKTRKYADRVISVT